MTSALTTRVMKEKCHNYSFNCVKSLNLSRSLFNLSSQACVLIREILFFQRNSSKKNLVKNSLFLKLNALLKNYVYIFAVLDKSRFLHSFFRKKNLTFNYRTQSPQIIFLGIKFDPFL